MGVSSRYEQHICLIVHLSCQTEKAGDGEQGCEAEGGGGTGEESGEGDKSPWYLEGSQKTYLKIMT